MSAPIDPIADIDRARANGMTLRAIAKAAGCNASTLWRIQQGQTPSLPFAQKLHDVARRSAGLVVNARRKSAA